MGGHPDVGLAVKLADNCALTDMPVNSNNCSNMVLLVNNINRLLRGFLYFYLFYL